MNSPFNFVCVGAAAQFEWHTTRMLENDNRNHSRPTRALPLPRNAFVAVSPRFPSKNDGAISSETSTKNSQMRVKLMQLSKTTAAQSEILIIFRIIDIKPPVVDCARSGSATERPGGGSSHNGR